jgi:hypothetical protein
VQVQYTTVWVEGQGERAFSNLHFLRIKSNW